MLDSIPAWLRLLMAALTGVVSGFGIGGGTLLVILLTLVFGIEQRVAQGTNLLYFLPTASASLIFHAQKGRILWGIWLPTAFAGVLTAIVASVLAKNLDVTWLRRAFGILLAYTGVWEVFAKE